MPPNFRPAPRETEADESGNIHTIDRRLKDRVYCMVQNGTKEEDQWIFPTVELKEDDDESLVEASERSIASLVKKYGLQVYYPSNAPIACSMDIIEDDCQYFGTKTFYMRIQYDDGNMSKGVVSDQHAWLDRQEIVDHLLQTQGDGQSKFVHYML